MQEITAGFDTLLRQASMTAEDHLSKAVSSIDQQFGAGYAAKHPELVAAMVTAASTDFNHAMLKLSAQDLRDGMSELTAAIRERTEAD